MRAQTLMLVGVWISNSFGSRLSRRYLQRPTCENRPDVFQTFLYITHDLPLGYSIELLPIVVQSAYNNLSNEFCDPNFTQIDNATLAEFVVWDENQETVKQFFILGGTFKLVSFLVFSGIALLAGSISSLINKQRGVGVFLKWLQIVVFVGIAIYIMIP